MHDIAVAEIHQEARVDWEDLIRSYNDNDLLHCCKELCDDIDDTEELNFMTYSKKA